MRFALAALALLGLAAAPTASAAADPVFIHVEPVVCVTDPCPPRVYCDTSEGGLVERERDCSHRVSVDVIDCLWGEKWVTYTVGPVTVRYTECAPPPA